MRRSWILEGACQFQNTAAGTECRADVQAVGADDHLAIISYGW